VDLPRAAGNRAGRGGRILGLAKGRPSTT